MRMCCCSLFIAIAFSCALQADDSRPVITPTKIEGGIVIDGLLNEEIWKRIEPITDFRQFEPDHGEAVSEGTEVWICYDDQHLYFAVRAFDSEPGRLISNIFERDGDVWTDDSFAIMIDSLNNQRSSFTFSTNVRGTQTDGQQDISGEWNGTWDPIWFSRGNVDAEGYTLEIAIPFFALRFRPQDEIEMGLLMRRNIPRKTEWAYWPELSIDETYYNMEKYAKIAGLKNVKRGVDVEIKPYLTGGYVQTSGDDDWHSDAGLDVKWGITPNLTADFTLNTDFSQVETDDFRINMTRFPLYYEEKRDFFSENEELFAFGVSESTELFFSRNIGIRNREEVPILGGARVYGQVGDSRIGLMSIQTRDYHGYEGENFSVARIKQNVFGRSYVGGIATIRSGDENYEDRSAGADFTLYHGPMAGLSGLLARSGRNSDKGNNWFSRLHYFNVTDLYDFYLKYADIGPNFDPGIGFTRQTDLRTVSMSGSWKPRPDWPGVRQLNFNLYGYHLYNYDGFRESLRYQFAFNGRFNSGDTVGLTFNYDEQFIPYDFEIAPDVIIRQAMYTYPQYWAYFMGSDSRIFDWSLSAGTGGYYDGDLKAVGIGFRYKPKPRFQFGLKMVGYYFTLPAGDYSQTIYSADMSYYFSPRLTTRIAMQYDDLYDDFFVNLRLRWLFAAGSEAWIVYDESRDFDTPGPSLTERSLIVKIVYNFNL